MSAIRTRPALSSRPARRTVPPLPIHEMLDATHREVMQVLGRLQQWVEQLDTQGIDADTRRTAGEICSFFDGGVREHHEAEELHVFPALVASQDAALLQHVRRLQQDHGWIEEDWLALAPQLRAIAAGYSWYDPAELQHGIEVFLELCREHIQLEESIIYPEAKARAAKLARRRATLPPLRFTKEAPSSS